MNVSLSEIVRCQLLNRRQKPAATRPLPVYAACDIQIRIFAYSDVVAVFYDMTTPWVAGVPTSFPVRTMAALALGNDDQYQPFKLRDSAHLSSSGAL